MSENAAIVSAAQPFPRSPVSAMTPLQALRSIESRPSIAALSAPVSQHPTPAQAAGGDEKRDGQPDGRRPGETEEARQLRLREEAERIVREKIAQQQAEQERLRAMREERYVSVPLLGGVEEVPKMRSMVSFACLFVVFVCCYCCCCARSLFLFLVGGGGGGGVMFVIVVTMTMMMIIDHDDDDDNDDDELQELLSTTDQQLD